jgi:hypothetical protein
MKEETDIVIIRELAKKLAYFDIKLDEDFSFMVIHPYIDNPYVQSDGALRNILENQKAYENFLKDITSRIDRITQYKEFVHLITKPYRSAFLSYTKDYIDKFDLAYYLKYLWVNTDYVNIDIHISREEYVGLFKSADCNSLMNERELNIYHNLPQTLTVYRGINSFDNHPIEGMSWTPDLEIATWFKNRFKQGKGAVYQATVYKKDILAYFEKEKETVVDYRKLKDVIKIV